MILLHFFYAVVARLYVMLACVKICSADTILRWHILTIFLVSVGNGIEGENSTFCDDFLHACLRVVRTPTLIGDICRVDDCEGAWALNRLQ